VKHHPAPDEPAHAHDPPLRRDVVALEGLGDRAGRTPLGLEALELAWDASEPILAARVVDDPRVGKYEALYRNSVTSLAVLPLRIDSNHKAALYLTNPQPEQLAPPMGGPVMLAYQNLVMLLVPRVIQAQRPSTVR